MLPNLRTKTLALIRTAGIEEVLTLDGVSRVDITVKKIRPPIPLEILRPESGPLPQ